MNAIVMVCYNSSTDTINCIESIRPSLQKHSDLLFLIDNSSDVKEITDLQTYLQSLHNPERILKGQELIDYALRFSHIMYFKTTSNIGFAKANNTILRYLQTRGDLNIDWIWFLNNDTLVDPSNYSKIVEYSKKTNANALYSTIHTFDDTYESSGLHYINLVTAKVITKKQVGYTYYVCGASLMVRYSKEMPFWNEAFFLYYEDIDYSFTLKKLGYVIERIPGAVIKHKVSASTGKVVSINIIKLQSQKIFMKQHAKCYVLYFVIRFIYYLLFARHRELKFLLNNV